MELNEYQILAEQTDQQPQSGSCDPSSKRLLIPLLGLAGESSELLSEYKKWLRDGESYKLFPERIKEELGDLLWYLSNVATKHDLTLEEIARYNLEKTRSRWSLTVTGREHRGLFDEDFPVDERLPRKMDVSISEDASQKVVMVINGVKTGDSLTDNRFDDDGYRFHDVFHLSYAAVLGWSPMLRAMLKCKRKSNPKVDEVEDGGRAIAIEEGIAAMVFGYAERRNFLDGAEGINYELLRTIKETTAHLEVGCRGEGDWERAIMVGFRLWRTVRVDGGCNLRADLEKGSLELVASQV